MKTIVRLALALLLLSLESLRAQSIEFSPALELRYQAQPGRAFRLESSTDLTTWMPWSPTRPGDGQPVRDLNALLAPIRQSVGVPALGCAAVWSNRRMIQEFLP